VNATGASRRFDIPRQLSCFLTLVAVLAAIPSASFAQSTSRPSQPSYSDLERLPVHGAPTTAPATQQTGLTGTANRPTNLISVPRLLIALAVVLVLIFFVRAVGQKFFPNITMSRASSAVRVLSRNPVAHKQQVVLVQVGRRILVLGDNGSQMNALSEITDPDEVAQLIGQISGTKERFTSEFNKAQDEFEQADGPMEQSDVLSDDIEHSEDALPEGMTAAHGEINGLMEKVRGLAKQLGR
jgi:flagellar biogenesis protein FliO